MSNNRRFLMTLLLLLALIYKSPTTLAVTENPKDRLIAVRTVPDEVQATYSVKRKADIQVNIRVLLDIDAVVGNPAGVTGSLLITIPEGEREKLARNLKINSSKVPKEIEVKKIRAEILTDSKCPLIKIVVKKLNSPFVGGSLLLEQQEMVIDHENSKSNIGELMCNWVSQINGGFGHAHRLLRPINEKIFTIKNKTNE